MAWNGSDGVATPRRTIDGKSSRKGSGLVLLGTALAVAGVFAWWGAKSGGAVADSAEDVGAARVSEGAGSGKILQKRNRKAKGAKDSVRDAMPKALPKNRRQGSRPKIAVDMLANLSGSDRQLAEAVQKALDSDDFDAAVAAATAALDSKNAEVRLNAVDALGWFGAQALPELTGAMTDASRDVREAAENHFELALQDLEKPQDQFNIAMAALGSLSSEDQIASLGGMVGNAAMELIDNEEDEQKRSENRIAVVQALVDVIEGDGSLKNREAAAEVYNDITGNEWNGIDEAERYLLDPENFDPDASPAPSGPSQDSEEETQF